MTSSAAISLNTPTSTPNAPSSLDNLGANPTSGNPPSGMDKQGGSGVAPKLRNTPGLTSVSSLQRPDSTLMAAGLPSRMSPIQRINKWNKAIIPAVQTYKPGAPIVPIKVPVAGTPTVKTGPRIDVPPGSAGMAPTSKFFGTGAPVVSAPGVPALTGQPSASNLAIVNAALPASTVGAFAALNQQQKLLARTMLGAAIQGLSANPSSPDYVAPKDFKPLVDLILKNAQAYKGATQIVPSSPPTKPAVAPKLPLDPAIVQTLPKDPKGAIKAAKKRTTPAATPNAAPSAAAVKPPEIPGLTLTPALYGELIKGADGKVDPVRKANTDNLLMQAQEFRAQIETINVKQAINPAKSTKTPMAEWRDWKAA
jgi:hypothetical protein